MEAHRCSTADVWTKSVNPITVTQKRLVEHLYKLGQFASRLQEGNAV